MNRRQFFGITAGGIATILPGSNGCSANTPPVQQLDSSSTTYPAGKQITDWIEKTPYSLAVPENADQINIWQKNARCRFRSMLGLKDYTFETPQFYEQKRFQYENLTVHRIVIEAAYPAGKWDALVIEPKDTHNLRPGWVCMHGFLSGGMSSMVGLVDGNEAVRPVLEERRCDYALELARRGYVTISFHCPGFGSRSNTTINDTPSDKLFINALGIQLPYLGWCVADAMTAVSVLTQWPSVNKDRIGAIGFSMGATTATWAGGLDDRINAIVWSGRVASYRNRFLKRKTIPMLECIPRLYSRMDKGSTIALAAPKPMFLSQEVRNDFPVARELVEPACRAWQFLQAEDKLSVHYDDRGKHMFIGEPAYTWIQNLWNL